MESLARKCITAYIMRVRMEDTASEAARDQAEYTKPDGIQQSDETRTTAPSPILAEGFAFLQDLVERIRCDPAMDDLSGVDVARFRLLANSISKPGNDEADLGAHDINTLFAASVTDGMELGRRETVTLVGLGFRHLQNENAPLWRWYSSLKDGEYDPAVIWSLPGANDAETIGAIKVLTSLGREIQGYRYLTRDQVISSWFSEGISARVRNAALAYLGRNGGVDDLSIVKSEYDRSDFATSRSALECMLQILLRTTSNHSAQELLLNSQFDSLSDGVLQAALSGFEGLKEEQLQLGLEHRNPAVRLRSLELLVERGCVADEVAERLTADGDALVRHEALATLSERGKSFSEEEVRRILAPPKKQVGGGILSGSPFAIGAENSGEPLFEKYRMDTLMRLSEAELETKVNASLMHDDDAYFALVDKYFLRQAKRVRRDVDDTYRTYFEERVRRVQELFGQARVLAGSSDPKNIVEKTRDLENYIRRKLTRRGLDVLCIKKRREDVDRIRTNLKSGYAEASKLDAEYLEKHGEWSDIALLVTAGGPKPGGLLGMSANDEGYQKAVAKAAYKIGRQSPSKLLSLDIPAAILQKVVALCAECRFSKMPNNALFRLLDHESEDVRRAAAIKAILSFSFKSIESILNEYVSRDSYRYYNVIHWLDLGVSMSRDDARKVARAASDART